MLDLLLAVKCLLVPMSGSVTGLLLAVHKKRSTVVNTRNTSKILNIREVPQLYFSEFFIMLACSRSNN